MNDYTNLSPEELARLQEQQASEGEATQPETEKQEAVEDIGTVAG